jgi:hypothetical protein
LFVLVCDTSLTGLLKLANSLANYAGRRQLIQASIAEAIPAGNSRTLDDIERAHCRDRISGYRGFYRCLGTSKHSLN